MLAMHRWSRFPPLTLFGRSLLLLVSELSANTICWVVTGVLFGRKRDTQPILSLALLAWVRGLCFLNIALDLNPYLYGN